MEKDTRTKEYIDKLGALKLSETSRERMKEGLVSYARFHPAENKVSSPHSFGHKQASLLATLTRLAVRIGHDNRSIQRVPQGTSLISRFRNSKFAPMNALVIITLLVSGGTSYAAAGSVPGDLLYPVKVEVNENIKSALAVSDSAEAMLQTRLAKERLAEAETLAARGELNAETSAAIAARLKNHYYKAIAHSDTAAAEGDLSSAATVRASLEGILSTYASVLTRLSADVDGNDSTSLVADIETYARQAATTQATATANISAEQKVSIEQTLETTDRLIASLEGKLQRAETKLSSETHAYIEARLAAAVEAQAQAKLKLESEVYRESYALAQSAIRIANETKTMLESSLSLDAGVDVKVGDLFDGVLDNSHEIGDNQRENRATSTETETQNETETENDVEVDVETNTEIDTDIIDTTVETGTVIEGNTGLSL